MLASQNSVRYTSLSRNKRANKPWLLCLPGKLALPSLAGHDCEDISVA